MSKCDRLRHLSDIEATSDPDLLRHAKTCPDCRLQRRINGRLRDLMQRMPRAGLSPAFNYRLRTTLAVEKQKQQENRWRLFLLQAYWVVAAAVSIIVLTQVRWPSMPPAPSVYVLGSVLMTVVVIPVLLLMRQRSKLAGFLSCIFTGELNGSNEGPVN